MRSFVVSILFATSFLLVRPVLAESQTPDLGDAMQMLMEQNAGLTDLSKLAPATITKKVFDRAIVRVRGARLLLQVIREKEGRVVDGVYAAGQMSPPKFAETVPSELPAFIGAFDDAIAKLSTLFGAVGNEVIAQATAKPEARSFARLSELLTQIDVVKKAAHKQFM